MCPQKIIERLRKLSHSSFQQQMETQYDDEDCSSTSSSRLSTPTPSLNELAQWKDVRHPGGMFCLRPDLCPLCWQSHFDCPSVNEIVNGTAIDMAAVDNDLPPSYGELFHTKRPVSAFN
ncbi:hypothetical protein TYRP_014205 [Tyrophagus putrescentiae]|nr:hypothetical protein TYRP_014205 [Tyrophagus putrescentiae]